MAFTSSFTSATLLLLVLATACQVSNALSSTYYNTLCPNLTTIVQTKVHQVVLSQPRMCASLLRLHFHDCFVQGCDGSILLNDTTTEQTAPPNNNSVRGFDVVNDIKSAVEAQCPGVVSCADLLALIAEVCVVELGGPGWTVLFGRRDSLSGNLNATINLPPPFGNISLLITLFQNQGLNMTDLVALSGAHTVGQAQCTNFKQRLYGPSQGMDCMDPSFNSSLQGVCPRSGGDTNLAPLDNQTANTFDNDYFINLLWCQGLLRSDQQLGFNMTTANLVVIYAMNQTKFFQDFATSMVKMGNINPLTSPNGQVRLQCWKKN